MSRNEPMTLPQSAVPDLLDAFRAGDGVNLIRDALQMVLQEMIETEAIEHIGAGRCCHSRIEQRTITTLLVDRSDGDRWPTFHPTARSRVHRVGGSDR